MVSVLQVRLYARSEFGLLVHCIGKNFALTLVITNIAFP